MEYEGMRSGFAEEAIDIAWATWQGRQAARHRVRMAVVRYVAGAAAVSLLVAALVSVPSPSRDGAGIANAGVTTDARGYMKNVNLLVRSRTALPNATITVMLDDHVRLAGYPADNRVSWRAPIAAGKNRLILPVILKGKTEGVISIAVDASGWHERSIFSVNQQGSRPISKRPT